VRALPTGAGEGEERASGARMPVAQPRFSPVPLNALTPKYFKMPAPIHDEQEILVISHLSDHHPID